MRRTDEAVKIFSAGLIRKPLRLQYPIKLRKMIERKMILKEFNELANCLVSYFIINVQTILTGEQYVDEIVTGVAPTIRGNVYVVEHAIIPTTSIERLHRLTDYNKFNIDEAYKGMCNIKYFRVDILKSYFSLYDYRTDSVDEKLVAFNSDFDWVVRKLKDLCLENPTMLIYEAMGKVISDLKEMMSQRDNTSQL